MRRHATPSKPEAPSRVAEPVVDRQVAKDKRTTRRRAELIHEVDETMDRDELAPLDELADKVVGKTVDDLVK